MARVSGCMESLTGIGSGQAPLAQCVALAQRPAVRQGWLNCQRLVIDEISMVEADLFDKLEAVARSVCAARAGFWWFSIWNLATSASKVPHAPMQSCPATGQAFWRDPAHHLWGLPTAATCNQGIPAPEVLLSGITHPPALAPDRCLLFSLKPLPYPHQAKSWRRCVPVTLELTEVWRQADQNFISLLQAVRLGRCALVNREGGKVLHGPIEGGHSLSIGTLSPPRLGPHHPAHALVQSRCQENMGTWVHKKKSEMLILLLHRCRNGAFKEVK